MKKIIKIHLILGLLCMHKDTPAMQSLTSTPQPSQVKDEQLPLPSKNARKPLSIFTKSENESSQEKDDCQSPLIRIHNKKNVHTLTPSHFASDNKKTLISSSSSSPQNKPQNISHEKTLSDTSSHKKSFSYQSIPSSNSSTSSSPKKILEVQKKNKFSFNPETIIAIKKALTAERRPAQSSIPINTSFKDFHFPLERGHTIKDNAEDEDIINESHNSIPNELITFRAQNPTLTLADVSSQSHTSSKNSTPLNTSLNSPKATSKTFDLIPSEKSLSSPKATSTTFDKKNVFNNLLS